MTRPQATAIGFFAVLQWALLALLTVGSAPVPPFQLTAMCFAIGGIVGVTWTGGTVGLGVLRGISWQVYAFGTAGLFGYHFLYFSALRMAPAAEAGLIAYLWPLLIVLFSGFLPGEHLRGGHVLGALVSFAGAALIVLGGATGFDSSALPGFALAGLCALTWSVYSVLSRRLGATPTASVGVFCLATAVLSGLAHLALEETVAPVGALGWAAVLGLGLGPAGVKRGDIQLLGVVSYAAPLLSTVVLILAGVTQASWSLLLAAVLITGGAALAARASTRPGT